MQVTDDRQRRRGHAARSSPASCSSTSCATTSASPARTGAATPRTAAPASLWMDGEPVKSCTVLTAMADGREVRTVEGLEVDGELDPVQEGFMREHGLQCGFCTPGMMMTARWLLDRDPDPDEATIREAISGQICRCTGYENIVRAIRWAAEHPVRARTEGGTGMTHRPSRSSPQRGRATRSASAACCARRTPASCAARATTSTTSRCRACCTAPSCAARTPTPASCRSTPPRPRPIPR